jgi:hypothetical protein
MGRPEDTETAYIRYGRTLAEAAALGEEVFQPNPQQSEPTMEMRTCVQRFLALRNMRHTCPNLCCCRCAFERLAPHLLAAWESER